MSNKVTIDAWVARDKDGELNITTRKPFRSKEIDYWIMGKRDVFVSCTFSYFFPEITWESEPKKVKVTIELEE